MSVRFGVDLDELDAAVQAMSRFRERLADRLDHADATVTELHLTWSGAAADAQHVAHREWMRGARLMHDALVEMAAAAQVAHRDYTAAAETNLAMWAGLA